LLALFFTELVVLNEYYIDDAFKHYQIYRLILPLQICQIPFLYVLIFHIVLAITMSALQTVVTNIINIRRLIIPFKFANIPFLTDELEIQRNLALVDPFDLRVRLVIAYFTELFLKLCFIQSKFIQIMHFLVPRKIFLHLLKHIRLLLLLLQIIDINNPWDPSLSTY